ncbi:MAG: CoA transferase [Dehalococcoidia bacterium]
MGVPFLEFLSCHTKKELYEGAVKRRIILYPESTTADLLENPQLKAREYFQRVEHPELQDSLLYPGAFIKMSETPCQVKRRPPLIGEHNDEVYLGELGLSSKEMAQLKSKGII